MTDWSQPKVIDGPSAAFGASPIEDYLPAYRDVPDEFKDRNARGVTWSNVVSRWFFQGLKGQFVTKPGIDHDTAMRHVGACLRSWAPKHEHKESGVAYLMSLWFERYEPTDEEMATGRFAA